MKNVLVKYEYFEETSVDNVVIYNGKTRYIKDILLEVIVNNNLLFVAIEQGVGKYEKSVFSLWKLIKKQKVKE